MMWCDGMIVHVHSCSFGMNVFIINRLMSTVKEIMYEYDCTGENKS